MRLAVFLCAVLVIAACDSTPGEVKADPSFAADIKPAFNANCVSCHSGTGPSGSYDLTSRAGALGPGSDSVANVIPGNASSSLLWQRLDDGSMPPAGRLDTVPIANVRNWINQGAKDN